MRGSAPTKKRSKCWWTSQQAGGPVAGQLWCGRGDSKLVPWPPTAKPGCEADGAIGGFDLEEEGTQDVDAPAGSRSPVLFPLRAWRRDGRVDKPVPSVGIKDLESVVIPVPALDVVIVATWSRQYVAARGGVMTNLNPHLQSQRIVRS